MYIYAVILVSIIYFKVIDLKHVSMTGARLQQLTEFNCVVKAFVYLASHIPRDELLEAPMNESIEQAVDAMKKISIIMMTAGVDLKKEDSFFDPNVAMSGFEAAIGRSSPKDAAGGTSLSDSEPDMFPCLVVICGSGFMFLKVRTGVFLLDIDF